MIIEMQCILKHALRTYRQNETNFGVAKLLKTILSKTNGKLAVYHHLLLSQSVREENAYRNAMYLKTCFTDIQT